MMNAIYPGSFDPLTMGHYDLVERASKMCSKLYVTIMKNSAKQTLFTIEERLHMTKEALKSFDNVVVESFDGLLIKYTEIKNTPYLIRGLRAISDFEFEFQLALMNRNLKNDLETIFLMPSQKYIFLSSTMIKDVARYGGDISAFVPPIVDKMMQEKFNT